MIADRLTAGHEIGAFTGGRNAARRERRCIERMADGLGRWVACRHQQRRLSQTVAGGQRASIETGPLKSLAESLKCGFADKLRAGECESPTAQVEPSDRFIGNAVGTQRVGEIRPTADVPP